MHEDDVARRDRRGGRGQARGRDQRSGGASNQGGRKSTSVHHHDTVSIMGSVFGKAKVKSGGFSGSRPSSQRYSQLKPGSEQDPWGRGRYSGHAVDVRVARCSGRGRRVASKGGVAKRAIVAGVSRNSLMHNALAKAFDLSIDVDERNLIQNSGSLFPIRPKNPCLHVEGTDGRAIPLCSGSGHGLRSQSAKQPAL